MNKVVLMGRLTKDPEVKQTPSNIAVCSFTVAVDRRFKSQNGEKQTDFINCVAWRQQATLLGNYFQKGSRVLLVGSLQTRSYEDQSGNRRTVTEVNVEEIEFVDTKSDAKPQAQEQPQPQAPFEPVPVPPLPFADVTGIEVNEEDVSQLPFSIE